MRHHDRADAFQVAQLDDLVVHGRRRNRIEAGGRFVVQQDPRLERHRPRDGHAAPLAARQLGRHLVDVLREADEAEHLFDALVDVLERHVGFFVVLVADVFAHGERVEERAFLKDHAEVGTDAHHLLLGQLIDALAVHPDDAGVGTQQARDDLQDRRLPRSARAQNDLRVALDDGEAQVFQHHLFVEGQLHVVEHDHRRARLAQNFLQGAHH